MNFNANGTQSVSKRACNSGSLAKWVRRLLRGEVSREEAMNTVAEYWGKGTFLRRVPADELPLLRITAPSRARYCCSIAVRNHVLYGVRGEPGCVLVIAPFDAAFDGDFRDLNVPMHIHNTDHIAVVMNGQGVFYAQRDLEDGPVVVHAEVEKGSVMFYPAGTPHTFAVGRHGISVASFQCDFESPHSPEFSRPVAGDLRRLKLVEYRDL